MIPMIIMAIEDEDDRSFMANLYVDYQRLMYKVIVSYTTNKWDADDIFQSTLPKLIDKLADLRRMSKDKLTNYIYSTCKNTAINYLQKKGGLKEFSFEELSSTIPADEDPRLLSKEDNEDIEALHRAWKKLDPRSQYLLEARYILNKSFVEIAEDINLQSGSVRTAISRARKKARKLILEEKARTPRPWRKRPAPPCPATWSPTSITPWRRCPTTPTGRSTAPGSGMLFSERRSLSHERKTIGNSDRSRPRR